MRRASPAARERMFCSGANIYMLGLSTHGCKVNFCKFTNETRNGIEDSSRDAGSSSSPRVNGTVAGGGYELALACDEILLIDDRSSTVSLPEVPLLGVLPGTGGLTRVDRQAQGAARPRRRLLHDEPRACAPTARKQWSSSTTSPSRRQFAQAVKDARRGADRRRARARARGKGIALTPLERTIDDGRLPLRARRRRRSTARRAPPRSPCRRRRPRSRPTSRRIHAAGASWWPLAMARELDDAILLLRTNELEIGTWLLKTARRRRRGARGRRDAREALAATGSCARRSACCAARSRASTSPRARSSRSSTRDRASPARSRARARRRPQLHAATARTSEAGAPTIVAVRG